MSGREWKPGDVAMAQRADGGDDFLVVRTRGDGDYWSAPKGWPWNVPAESLAGFRPLVVIDPEDRDAVERLLDAHPWHGATASGVDDMQAALREFANPTPPKPAEPTGLGAVVEDAKGRRYVRHGSPEMDDSVAWCDQYGIGRSWERIDAVKVLSEGVQP